MFHSYTSSSKTLIRDISIVLIVIVAVEVYFAKTMVIFEKKTENTETVTEDQNPNYYVLGQQNPVSFFRDLKTNLTEAPIVFIGDSQGAGAHGGGYPYPRQIAENLKASGDSVPIVSLHIGGANVYEQTVLLLTMLKEGITPYCVVWSSSIFSLRKNEIRAEFSEAYYFVEDEMKVLAPNVIVPHMAEDSVVMVDPFRQLFVSWSAYADRAFAHLATVRFMHRSLWDKAQILRRSPLGSLIPSSLLTGTAQQYNPPSSILEDATRLIGEVTRELGSQDISIVVFLAPINRVANPRPFSESSEGVAYPSLQQSIEGECAVFLNLVDALAPDNFGSFSDGTQDAFHINAAGHSILADTLLKAIYFPENYE